MGPIPEAPDASLDFNTTSDLGEWLKNLKGSSNLVRGDVVNTVLILYIPYMYPPGDPCSVMDHLQVTMCLLDLVHGRRSKPREEIAQKLWFITY